MKDESLSRTIAMAVGQLERDGELVVTCPSVQVVADRITDAALEVVPHSALSLEELAGVRSLILLAIADDRFFDWEMPTRTGFSAAGFRSIAEKLPRGD
ncbi:hypothetical protein BH10PSE15_BH10PSE15_17040 [soil metagenome]